MALIDQEDIGIFDFENTPKNGYCKGQKNQVQDSYTSARFKVYPIHPETPSAALLAISIQSSKKEKSLAPPKEQIIINPKKHQI